MSMKLNTKVIHNDLLKYMSKLQTDLEPGIRTNTTICLGKLSPFLDEDTRNRVLVTAFTRALHDPFPPSRTAALLAISVTVEYNTLNDIALKLIPSVSLLTADSNKYI